MKKNHIKYGIAFLSIAVLFVIFVICFQPDNLQADGYIYDLGNNREIYLVEISGMRNKLIQFKINRAIKEETLVYLADCQKEDKYVEGEGWYSGIIANRYFYVINTFRFERNYFITYYSIVFDMRTGKKVEIGDLFEVDDSFVEIVKEHGKEYTYDLGESLITVSGYENETEEYISQWISDISMTQEEWNMLEGKLSYEKPSFMISENDLYLRVPIPLDKLEDFLKVSKWW